MFPVSLDCRMFCLPSVSCVPDVSCCLSMFCLPSVSCVPDVSSVSRLSNVLSSFFVLCSQCL